METFERSLADGNGRVDAVQRRASKEATNGTSSQSSKKAARNGADEKASRSGSWSTEALLAHNLHSLRSTCKMEGADT